MLSDITDELHEDVDDVTMQYDAVKRGRVMLIRHLNLTQYLHFTRLESGQRDLPTASVPILPHFPEIIRSNICPEICVGTRYLEVVFSFVFKGNETREVFAYM